MIFITLPLVLTVNLLLLYQIRSKYLKLLKMPSCVVKYCTNNSTTNKKSDGITFHKFSKKNNTWKNDWVEIIRHCRGEDEWCPSRTSVICSTHFDERDIYTTKNGLRRVVSRAVPRKFLLKVPKHKEEQPAKQKKNNGSQRTPSSEVAATNFEPNGPRNTSIPSLQTQTIEIEVIHIKKEPSELSDSPESPSAAISLQQTQSMDELRTHVKQEPSLDISESPSTTIPLKQTELIEIQITNIKKESSTEVSESPFTNIPISQTQTIYVRTDIMQEPSQPIDVRTDIIQEPSQPIDVRTDFIQESLPELPKSPSTTPLLQMQSIEAGNHIKQESSMEVSGSPSTTIPLLQIQPAFKQTFECDEYLTDTPRERCLRKSLIKKQITIDSYKKKIKTLNQRIRRLTNRNKSLIISLSMLRNVKPPIS